MRGVLESIVLSAAITPLSLTAQTSSFVYTFGKNQNEYSWGAGVLVTPQYYLSVGDALLGGGGNRDGTVIKMDNTGNLLWYATYGGPNNDILRFPFLGVDGNYDIFGSYGGYPLFLKVAPNGNPVYHHTYSFSGELKGVVKDGVNYVAVGFNKTTERSFVMIMDSSATPLGMYEYDLPYLEGVHPDGSGGYVVVGGINRKGFAMRIDGSGNVLWAKTYDGPHDDVFKDVLVASSHVFVLGSTTSQGAGNWDLWVARLNLSDGSVVWSKTYGGLTEDQARSLMLNGGKLGILAYTRSWGSGGAEWWMLEVGTDGSVLESFTLGGNGDDFPSDGDITPDGGYFIVGYTQTPAFGAGGAFDHMVAKLSSHMHSCIKSDTPSPVVMDFPPVVDSVSPQRYVYTPTLSTPPLTTTKPNISVNTVCSPLGGEGELALDEWNEGCGTYGVVVAKGGVEILKAGKYDIYSPNGTLVRSVNGKGFVRLKRGLYIVRGEGGLLKVLVR